MVVFITTTTLAIMLKNESFRRIHEQLRFHLSQYDGTNPLIHVGENFNSHITIGRRRTEPMTAQLRQRVLNDLSPVADEIPSIYARIVRLYAKPNNSTPYMPLLDIELA